MYQNAEFPSPSRGSYFSIGPLSKEARQLRKFPSPSRGSYFSIKVLFGAHGNWKSVSVPFPGILFLNTIQTIVIAMYSLCFRPLPGDLISQFEKKIANENSNYSFPSPSRGSYFSIGKLGIALIGLAAVVSVPFPGILFLNNHVCTL